MGHKVSSDTLFERSSNSVNHHVTSLTLPRQAISEKKYAGINVLEICSYFLSIRFKIEIY